MITRVTFFALAFMLTACVGTASAGPNQGGTILLHYNLDIIGCEGSWCGLVALSDCEEAVVTMPGSIPGGAGVIGPWFVFAAFPTGSHPRMAATNFGIDYDPSQVFPMVYLPCSDRSEMTASPAWPSPGSGVSLAWNTARTASLDIIYYFYGYGYQGETVSLTPHPILGGTFSDDAVPPHVDAIAGYGTLGFGVDGVRACPEAIGACCDPDGSCLFTNGPGRYVHQVSLPIALHKQRGI